MTLNRFSDSARYWRSPLVPGADMLTAEYHDHAFTPHWHDAYTVPVIEAGAERYDYRGSNYVAEAGSVPVINPGELHTGARAVDAGWRYRVFYLPVEFVQAVADEVAGRAAADALVLRPMSFATPISRNACARASGAGSRHRSARRRSTRCSTRYRRLLARHAGQRPSVVRAWQRRPCASKR